MSASYAGWLTWAANYEPAALTGFAGGQVSLDAYNESVDMCAGLDAYIPANTFTLLVYKLALHNFILSAESEPAPVDTLYTKYSVKKSFAIGLLQSTSDSSSSATRVIPDMVQKGDMATMFLWSTPYGKWCESIFEQMTPFAVVVR